MSSLRPRSQSHRIPTTHHTPQPPHATHSPPTHTPPRPRKQAVLEDMPELLGDEPLLLDALREGDAAGGADPAAAAAAVAAASPGGALAGAGRACLARAAANAGSQLSKLLYLTEHLLALVYTHLRLCLPAPALGGVPSSPDKGMLAVADNDSGVADAPGVQTLGSERVRVPNWAPWPGTACLSLSRLINMSWPGTGPAALARVATLACHCLVRVVRRSSSLMRCRHALAPSACVALRLP